MSTDSQGRPLSDDGQWAWSGTEWVPAAGGGAAPGEQQAAEPYDPNATMITSSPLSGGQASGQPPHVGTPQPAYGSTPQPPQGGAPSYGSTPADSPGYAATQVGYGSTPAAAGYGTPAATPGFGGVPPQQKSKTPLIAAIVGGVVVVAAVVVILILALGGSSKKGPVGAFQCTSGTEGGTLTFNKGNTYGVSDGTPGSYTRDGDKITFNSGTFKSSTGTVSNGAKRFDFKFRGTTFVCKQ